MIVSGGELVLAESAPSFGRMSYYPSRGLSLAGPSFASYNAIYRNQTWVYTVVRKRAKATARLPLKVYLRGEDGRDDARDADYALLLRSPNPRMNTFTFWEWVSSTLDIYGEAILLKVRGAGGRPKELWPAHPANISVENHDGEFVYVYTAGGIATGASQLIIPERDIVHFKTFNPDTTTRGLSPLEPLRQTLVNEDAMRRSSSAFWQNAARPSMYLSHPNVLGDAAAQRLKSQWDSIHSGVDNFGKTAILEEGMEPKMLSLSPEEAQYIDSKRLNREEVCAVYDVPPPVVHILDRATFSNITEQMRSMYRDTMAPHLSQLEATLDQQLRPEFSDDSLYAEFLMDEVLRGSFEARATAYQQADYMTVAEKRRAENLPFVDGSDVILVNGAYVPLALAGQRTVAPIVPATRVLTTPVVSKVTKRVANRSVLAELDVDALTAGLNGSTSLVLATLEESLVAGDTPGQFCERLWSLVKEDT